ANLANKAANISLRKDNHRVHVTQSSQQFGTFGIRHNRTPFALELADRVIRIHCHHKTAAELLGRPQIADVTNMQHIKSPVGESDRLSCLPPSRSDLAQLFTIEDLLCDRLFCTQWDLIAGGACCKAFNNSTRDTVAVPLFITTIPPA